MITKNPMQLKAFIKKKAAEKNISARSSCRTICWNGCLNGFLSHRINIISF